MRDALHEAAAAAEGAPAAAPDAAPEAETKADGAAAAEADGAAEDAGAEGPSVAELEAKADRGPSSLSDGERSVPDDLRAWKRR